MKDLFRCRPLTDDLQLKLRACAVYVEVDHLTSAVAVARCVTPDLCNLGIVERFLVLPIVSAVVVGGWTWARDHPGLAQE
jgi:hypothetical protein